MARRPRVDKRKRFVFITAAAAPSPSPRRKGGGGRAVDIIIFDCLGTVIFFNTHADIQIQTPQLIMTRHLEVPKW